MNDALGRSSTMMLDPKAKATHFQPVTPEEVDSELLRRAQAGDVDAFEQLVEKHQDRVYSVALRMTRSDADAAEISQEVFLAAFRHLKEFRGEAAFSSWVHRISANQSLMRLRHRKVVNQVEQPLESPEFNERGSLIEDVADWQPNALHQALNAELQTAISRASESLAEEYRQVFLLKDVEGLSYEDISELTGHSVPAIKSRLHRARLSMRASIHHFFQDVE